MRPQDSGFTGQKKARLRAAGEEKKLVLVIFLRA